jgi:hypothetical protein
VDYFRGKLDRRRDVPTALEANHGGSAGERSSENEFSRAGHQRGSHECLEGVVPLVIAASRVDE